MERQKRQITNKNSKVASFSNYTVTAKKSWKIKLKVTFVKRAKNKKVTWSSSNEGVATVKNGTVVGVSTGTAQIKVQSQEDNSYLTKTVHVYQATNKVILSEKKKELSIKGSSYGSFKITPTTDVTGTCPTFSFQSSNEKVAKVSTAEGSSATITAVAGGKTVITVKTLDGTNKSAKVTVTVIKPITKITITYPNAHYDENGLLMRAKGYALKPTVTIEPADATNKKIKWTCISSDSSVVSVNKGVITGRKATTSSYAPYYTAEVAAYATAQDSGGVTSNIYQKKVVVGGAANKIGFKTEASKVVDSVSVSVGSSVILYPVFYYYFGDEVPYVSYYNLELGSNDSTIATVTKGYSSGKGIATFRGIKKGKTTIWAQSMDGTNKKTKITVTVK